MRLRILLFLLLVSGGILHAGDTIRSLVITEVRLTDQGSNYIEITNMGTKAVDLSQFELGTIRPWASPWTPEAERFFMLPKKMLDPGKSYMVTTGYDFAPEQYAKKTPGFEGGQRPKQPEMYKLADMVVHVSEPKGDATDSITVDPKYGRIQWAFENWSGRECMYIEQHLSETDSMVIDQVGGVFDVEGRNRTSGRYDVAGVTGATGNSILVRRYSVKTGNIDFANARGVGLDDSEWIPIPTPGSSWRDVFWTVGNHGDNKLDATTLESTSATIDFAAKTITVPWGTRRGDGVMKLMKRKPGLAWVHKLKTGTVADSLTFAAQTGDTLQLYVCGSTLQKADFVIKVLPATPSANVVVPVSNQDPTGAVQLWRDDNQEGILAWPRVTQNASGKDSITGTWFGIPYATRVDTLLERLEKAPKAKWDFVWVDGVKRADLKHGDKLRVTAENGTVKEYFIEMQKFQPSHNAYLASITWPDIPQDYKGLFGWKGDTIPSFTGTTYNYRIQVPMGVQGIPALVAKSEELNAKIEVIRASSLSGTTAERTIKFKVTAEDDSVSTLYNVELVKEKDLSNIQPYAGEPFLSELVFWDQWSNSFAEIANPGNQPMDLSNYMFGMNWNTNPAGIITSRMGATEWADRYDKYVPGYKWVGEAQWAVTPGILVQDLGVNPIIQPGDVFAFGAIYTDGQTYPSWLANYKWPVPDQLDVQFNNYTGGNKKFFPNGYKNPWGENISGNGSPIRKWSNSSWFMWKILNDSIKQGLKPANDPNDFELIETFSMSATTDWVIGGKKANMITNWMRKPEIYKPNTGFDTQGSFGTTPETSEWTYTDQPYWQKKNAGWPLEILNVGNDIGKHFMYEPTQYKSTVTSPAYKVSEGYSNKETIKGMRTGVTVAEFVGNITKANEKQSLNIKSKATGKFITGAEKLNQNDTLIVLSADSVNTSKYILSVTAEGLSSNAVLTSNKYTIKIVTNPSVTTGEGAVGKAGTGTISGVEYGTQLKTVLANLIKPVGATITTLNSKGEYVPNVMLNFDSMYVDVIATHDIFYEVLAEDGKTVIMYQVVPTVSQSSAFILSDVYDVSQKDLVVNLVPRGTTVKTAMKNIVPSFGATMQIVDKNGLVRLDGDLYQDDKIVVTSADKKVNVVYYLSMLRDQYITSTTYLAYVMSNIYAVDQVNYVITGATAKTLLSDFNSKITPVTGATTKIVDKTGATRTVTATSDLNGGDKLVVTSKDGKFSVEYTLNLDLTSADLTGIRNIELYPNPTNSNLTIGGVNEGGRIHIYNAAGTPVRNILVRTSREMITLEDQPNGMYIIIVTEGDNIVGRFKAVKQ